MIKFIKKIDDPSGIVSKLIFEDGNTIVESVLYQYKDRGVICFSVQSGCKVGCSFCGTGKRFIRDLTAREMRIQIEKSFSYLGKYKLNKVQIMSMSMGEPMDNWDNVFPVVKCYLDKGFHFYVSTVGVWNYKPLLDFLNLATEYDNFGLQFSLHHYNNKKRKKLLGNFKDLMDIKQIETYSKMWEKQSNRFVYFNYICHGNETAVEIRKIYKIVKGHHLTCSVLCNNKKYTKASPSPAIRLANIMLALGNVEVSIFDPAGQDTIGGGCGQLLYVQEKMKQLNLKKGGLYEKTEIKSCCF